MRLLLTCDIEIDLLVYKRMLVLI